MKQLILVIIVLVSTICQAEIGVFLGARSGSTDASSFTSGGGISPQTGQGSYEGGFYFNHNWNSIFGFRTGIMGSQFAYGYYLGTLMNSFNGTETVFAVPLYLKADLGAYFSLIAGGYYWTVVSNTCSDTGIFAGSKCYIGNGAGVSPRGGFGLNFGKTFELDLFYEPSALLNSATTANYTVTSYALDLVLKF